MGTMGTWWTHQWDPSSQMDQIAEDDYTVASQHIGEGRKRTQPTFGQSSRILDCEYSNMSNNITTDIEIYF